MRRSCVSPGLHLAEKLSGRIFGSLPVVGLLSALALLVLVRVAGTVRESERLRLEVADQNQRLLHLDKMKDEFVASVSHELRTPLTSIRGYLELIRDDENIDEEQKKMLSIVDRNVDRLLRLVSDLLFVAQREDAEVVISELDLMELARDGVEAARPQARTAAVTLHLHGESALLRGDPSQLSQVIDNLISNAIKFTPAGGHIDVRVDGRVEQVVLAVSDNGMGIPKDEQADLFRRFFRARGANTAAIQGTGLGLSIVKQIVESHGGTVGFTSREGLGTTFTVELPGNPQPRLARPLRLHRRTVGPAGPPARPEPHRFVPTTHRQIHSQCGSAGAIAMSAREDSNLRPADQKSAALSPELRARAERVPRPSAQPAPLPSRPAERLPCIRFAVAVAQLVEPRVVVPVVAGSSPVRHPFPSALVS